MPLVSFRDTTRRSWFGTPYRTVRVCGDLARSIVLELVVFLKRCFALLSSSRAARVLEDRKWWSMLPFWFVVDLFLLCRGHVQRAFVGQGLVIGRGQLGGTFHRHEREIDRSATSKNDSVGDNYKYLSVYENLFSSDYERSSRNTTKNHHQFREQLAKSGRR